MSLVTSLDQLDQALTIARKHGVTQIKIGDLEAVLGLPVDTRPDRTAETIPDTPKDIDLESYHAFKNI